MLVLEPSRGPLKVLIVREADFWFSFPKYWCTGNPNLSQAEALRWGRPNIQLQCISIWQAAIASLINVHKGVQVAQAPVTYPVWPFIVLSPSNPAVIKQQRYL